MAAAHATTLWMAPRIIGKYRSQNVKSQSVCCGKKSCVAAKTRGPWTNLVLVTHPVLDRKSNNGSWKQTQASLLGENWLDGSKGVPWLCGPEGRLWAEEAR